MRAAIIIGVGVVALSVVLFLFLPIYRPAPVSTDAQPQRPASGTDLTQRDNGEGAVDVEVTLVGRGSPEAVTYQTDTQTVFLVSMNTHSVDLAAYDLVKISELLAGGRTLAPTRWVSTSDSPHHRSGALIFAHVKNLERGVTLELRIKTIAGVPVRVFRWGP